ncbi:MAG: hypothetical protein IPN90_11315 [Elusimicrobia bacterium]|nr:hypothetical protein [Elusimicrobiota bacterium]
MLTLCLLLVFTLLVPLLLRLTREESLGAVKDVRVSQARHAANMGLVQAESVLAESRLTWQNALAGTFPAGFDGNTVYQDSVNGSYKIWMSSGPGQDIVTVRVTGRDKSQAETRSLRALFRAARLSAPVTVTGTFPEWPIVHWGPIVGNDLSFATLAPNPGFPRKLSRTNCARNVVPPGDVDFDNNLAAPPNTDNTEWWSWSSSAPVNPVPDFDFYRETAMASVISNTPDATTRGVMVSTTGFGAIQKISNTVAVASPAGSGYFPRSMNMSPPNGFQIGACNPTRYSNSCPGNPGAPPFAVNDPNAVLFFENDSLSSLGTGIAGWEASVSLNAIQLNIQALIVRWAGASSSNAGGFHLVNFGAASLPVIAPIPPEANREYQSAVGMNVWNSVDPINGRSMNQAFVAGIPWSFKAHMSGYLFCDTNQNMSGLMPITVYGAVHCARPSLTSPKLPFVNVYYNPATAQNVRLNSPPERVSVQEGAGAW